MLLLLLLQRLWLLPPAPAPALPDSLCTDGGECTRHAGLVSWGGAGHRAEMRVGNAHEWAHATVAEGLRQAGQEVERARAQAEGEVRAVKKERDIMALECDTRVEQAVAAAWEQARQQLGEEWGRRVEVAIQKVRIESEVSGLAQYKSPPPPRCRFCCGGRRSGARCRVDTSAP